MIGVINGDIRSLDFDSFNQQVKIHANGLLSELKSQANMANQAATYTQ